MYVDIYVHVWMYTRIHINMRECELYIGMSWSGVFGEQFLDSQINRPLVYILSGSRHSQEEGHHRQERNVLLRTTRSKGHILFFGN